MYLSRLILDPRSRQVRRELSDSYQMHRTIMHAFPDADKGGPGRVLFRIDQLARGGPLVLLVQSESRPDWDWLAEKPGYLDVVQVLNPAVKQFSLTLAPGQQLFFRLRANPTVKRRFGPEDHKRVGLYREDEQREWLARKAQSSGFRLLTLSAHQEGMNKTWVEGGQEGRRRASLLAVRFDGLLQVTDPGQLENVLRQGIGSGKGFGFGLLSLAPAAK